MISLEQRIINYVNANQPVTAGQASNSLNISKKIFIEIKHNLEKKGLLFTKRGFGVFRNFNEYRKWMQSKGKKRMSSMGKIGGKVKGIERMGSDEIYDRISNFIPTMKEPLTSGEISRKCGVNERSGFQLILKLVKIGILQHDGATYARRYFPLLEQSNKQYFSKKSSSGALMGSNNYNKNENDVIQKYKTSPARARILALYGKV